MITHKEGWTKKLENVRCWKRKVIKGVIKPEVAFMTDTINII